MVMSVVRAPEESVSPLRTVEARKVLPLHEGGAVKAHVDFAGAGEDGGLAFIGWIFDPTSLVRGFALLQEAEGSFFSKRTFYVRTIKDENDCTRLVRVDRADVSHAMSLGEDADHEHGFALVVPGYSDKYILALELTDGRYLSLKFEIQQDPADILESLRSHWTHSGSALVDALDDAFGPEHSLSMLAASLELEGKRLERRHNFCSCDQAFSLNDRVLILNGWIANVSNEIERIELLAGDDTYDITAKVGRYSRLDLFTSFPWSVDNPLGFLCVLPGKMARGAKLKIKVRAFGGQRNQTMAVEVQRIDWTQLGHFVSTHGALAPSLVDELSKITGLENSAKRHEMRLSELRRSRFMANYASLPMQVEQSGTLVAAIDRAYALDQAGLLIFGWTFTPKGGQPAFITVGSEGRSVDVTNRLVTTLRADVSQHYGKKYPRVNDWCGFVCWAPFPTRAGDARSLCFDFGERGDVWLKIPTDRHNSDGLELMKEVLGMLPAPDRMRHKLFDVFESGVGHALEEINQSRAGFQGQVEIHQFGEPVSAPRTSIIVPLYGRFDFLRHQLAQFADDPDFSAVDLIYVVDDPRILSETLDLAARYQPLFQVPFRIVSHGENRGFAGANNIGASVARGEYLALVNSDVIPQHPGWVSTMQAALETLPDAGAVGPLLQFGDNSVQHAGMYPRTDSALPGFSLNTHPGMGMAWEGGNAPSEHPMLTAACLMLRRHDYEELGGFDEGYVIGDFEDSDLCLALRKKGKRLWLVPEARLWHLERQSQNLANVVGQRQMITLFNAWRYTNKIRTGELVDPALVEVGK